MAHHTTASEMCESVLKSLRNSNLHFLVQESPYSAYVTIRKRFSRTPALSQSPQESRDDTQDLHLKNFKIQIDTKDQTIADLELCNNNLKQANEDLSRKLDKLKSESKNSNKVKAEKDFEN